MKRWEFDYKGHRIQVENSLWGNEKLLVDGELQDERRGLAFRSQLIGRIQSGEGAGEQIKVNLGGWMSVNCKIFVNDRLVYSS